MAEVKNIIVHGISTPVWGLSHTAQEIDDGIDKSFAMSNPNLLRNWRFLVNQHKFLAGAVPATSRSYTLDGWHVSNTATRVAQPLPSLGQDYMILNALAGSNAFLWQPLDDVADLIKGAQVTLSVEVYVGGVWGIRSSTQNIPLNPTAATYCFISGFATIFQSNGRLFVRLTSADGVTNRFRSVKLEIGGASTLANDVYYDAQADLLLCQRYFYRQYGADDTRTVVGAGFANSATQAIIEYDLPTEMRTTPTVGGWASGVYSFRSGTTSISVTAIACSFVSGRKARVTATLAGGATANAPGVLCMTGSSNYIEFDAELPTY